MKTAAAALSLAILAGCSMVPDIDQRIESADDKAKSGGLIAGHIETGPFELKTYHRGLNQTADWHVYLEGDGQAFLTRTRLSPDPTPIDPIGLDLALADSAPSVLYLGRPCQYRPKDQALPCPSRYWSSHRFADEVVAATVDAISAFVSAHGDGRTDLTLIGYSGGGVLAALVASRLEEVKRLITVAAPLDLSTWSEHHGITPLHGSRNPVTIASTLTMPQRHLSGTADAITPPTLQRSFINALPETTRVRREEHAGFDHVCCWREHWASLISR